MTLTAQLADNIESVFARAIADDVRDGERWHNMVSPVTADTIDPGCYQVPGVKAEPGCVIEAYRMVAARHSMDAHLLQAITFLTWLRELCPTPIKRS